MFGMQYSVSIHHIFLTICIHSIPLISNTKLSVMLRIVILVALVHSLQLLSCKTLP